MLPSLLFQLLYLILSCLSSSIAVPTQHVLVPSLHKHTMHDRPFAVIIGGSYTGRCKLRRLLGPRGSHETTILNQDSLGRVLRTGWRTAECLVQAKHLHQHFRVLMIEQHSHFEHIFAFPRFGVVNGLEVRKAFVPFRPGPSFEAPESFDGQMLQAKVVSVARDTVILDRDVVLDGQATRQIPYKYLVSVVRRLSARPASLTFS